MKKFNILLSTSAFALLATGCVKPTQDTTQSVYTNPNTASTQSVYNSGTQPIVYEEAQPIVYESTSSSSGTVYGGTADSTVISTTGLGQEIGSTTTYPDPYANNSAAVSAYPDPYANQPIVSDYPASTTTSAAAQGGGIHLQIAALKDYSTAEAYKNRLSLAPGLSAYVQRGAVNKVIVSGIPSVSEANRLKESRFPGAFIVQGGTMGGYTPPVDTSSTGAYSINNPYGSSSSSTSTASGVGVQIGAFGSQSKAQSVANSQGGQYQAIVKKIGQYYKVILTGFSSRSAARAHAGTVGGFVVNY